MQSKSTIKIVCSIILEKKLHKMVLLTSKNQTIVIFLELPNNIMLWKITQWKFMLVKVCTMEAISSPEPLLDFCMHYMRDYRASPHFRRFLLLYLAKIGENGG